MTTAVNPSKCTAGSLRNGVVIFVLLFTFSVSSIAAPLTPGATISPAPAEPDPMIPPAVQIFTTNVFFNSGTFSGHLVSSVFSNDTTGPYSSGLTFAYELTIDGGLQGAELGICSWDAFNTDASYKDTVYGVFPTAISRSDDGETIFFDFETVASPLSSFWLVVQSDSPTFDLSIATVEVNGSSIQVLTAAPVACVPEPATVALIGLSLILFPSGRAAFGRPAAAHYKSFNHHNHPKELC